MASAVNGEFAHFLQLQSQLFDSPGTLGKLFLRGGTLHGQHRTAHLHIGSRQFQQDVQPGNRPGGGKIVLLPAVCHRFLGSCRDAPGGNSQAGQDFLQPFHPLAQRIQQGHLCLRAGDGQRHSGKARSAAHVDELFAPQIGAAQHRQAVQQMKLRHLGVLGDGRQIHDFVLLDHGSGKGAQLLLPLLRQIQTQPGQTLFQGFLHQPMPPFALTMPLKSTLVLS